MTTPKLSYAGPCCAHLRIVYARQTHADGTLSDRWECDLCKTEFAPAHWKQLAEDERRARQEADRINASLRTSIAEEQRGKLVGIVDMTQGSCVPWGSCSYLPSAGVGA